MSGTATRSEKKEPPKTQEVISLQWDALTPGPRTLTHIQDLNTVKEANRELKEILGFRTCMKDSILLDYYVCGFWWTKETNFTPAQVSVSMAVLHMLLDTTREKQEFCG